jgi:hypothetical protein
MQQKTNLEVITGDIWGQAMKAIAALFFHSFLFQYGSIMFQLRFKDRDGLLILGNDKQK